jgi:hypothetical protein
MNTTVKRLLAGEAATLYGAKIERVERLTTGVVKPIIVILTEDPRTKRTRVSSGFESEFIKKYAHDVQFEKPYERTIEDMVQVGDELESPSGEQLRVRTILDTGIIFFTVLSGEDMGQVDGAYSHEELIKNGYKLTAAVKDEEPGAGESHDCSEVECDKCPFQSLCAFMATIE